MNDIGEDQTIITSISLQLLIESQLLAVVS